MDAESFGPEALSEVFIFEKRTPAAIPATSKPQQTPVPGYWKFPNDLLWMCKALAWL